MFKQLILVISLFILRCQQPFTPVDTPKQYFSIGITLFLENAVDTSEIKAKILWNNQHIVIPINNGDGYIDSLIYIPDKQGAIVYYSDEVQQGVSIFYPDTGLNWFCDTFTYKDSLEMSY